MRLFVSALALITTPAMAADQFDLVCKGEKRTEERYRVDLARGEWCFGKCERIMKIAEVTSGMITLNSEKPVAPDFTEAYNTINRLTGEWHWYHYDPKLPPAMDIRGTCAP